MKIPNRQYPKELDGLDVYDKQRVMDDIEELRNIELAEEKQFF